MTPREAAAAAAFVMLGISEAAASVRLDGETLSMPQDVLVAEHAGALVQRLGSTRAARATWVLYGKNRRHG